MCIRDSIWLILTEIARRYQEKIENYYHDPAKTSELAIIWDGQVRMANLCIAGGMAVNGVSAVSYTHLAQYLRGPSRLMAAARER